MTRVTADSRIVIVFHTPGESAEYRPASGARQRVILACKRLLRALLVLEAVDAGLNLVAGVHFRVLRRQSVQERSVPGAEVADADGAVGVAGDFEVAARQKLI